MDIGNLNIAVFVDLKKAFDTVDHTILLNKLQYYDFVGDELKWIESYLSITSKKCFANGVLSNTGIMKCSVPQGSILGPLLFLIFINDLLAVSLIQHKICMQRTLALLRNTKILTLWKIELMKSTKFLYLHERQSF